MAKSCSCLAVYSMTTIYDQAQANRSPLQILTHARQSLLIRRLAVRDDYLTDALYSVAMGDRIEWTRASLKVLHKELTSSDICLGDWLALNS